MRIEGERAVRTLHGRRMGIVGLGSIGLEVARVASAFGLRVSAIRRRARSAAPDGVDEVLPPERLGDLLGRSDVVVLSAPVTAATRGLIGRRELGRMKAGAFLVNIGRGKLVDDAAAGRGARIGRLGGAALDVFTHEPLDAGEPVLGSAERDRHAAHVGGDGRLLDAARRALLRQPPALRRGARLLNVVDKRRRILG